MNINIEQLLRLNLSENAEERENATNQLQQLNTLQGFTLELAKFCSDTGKSVETLPIQQLAALLLKQNIKAYWEQGFESNGQYEIPSEEKSLIRAIAVSNLHLIQDSKLQTALCVAIASIAQFDWPENWPELWPQLMSLLESTNIRHVEGGVRCLSHIMDNFNTDYLTHIVPSLFPRLQRIFQDGNTPQYTRAKVTSVVKSCIHLISTLAQAGEQDAISVLSVHVNIWIPLFIAELKPENLSVNQNSMSIDIVRTLTTLVTDWPKHMGPVLPTVLPKLWQVLFSGVDFYQKNLVCPDEDIDETCYGSDGDDVSLSCLVVEMFELIRSLIQGKNKQVRRIIYDNCDEIAYNLIGYLQVTTNQLQLWEEDQNQYVADEDDDTLQYNVRNDGGKLIEDFVLCSRDKSVTLSHILAATQRRLHEQSDWKMHEAALLGIGNVASYIVLASKNNKIADVASFNLMDFQSKLLNVVAHEGSCLYLRVRALWCASRFAEILTSEQLTPFISAATTGVDHSQPLPVRLYSCRAIYSFFRSPSGKQVIIPVVGTILERLLVLAKVTSPDTLHFVLETIIPLLKCDEAATASICPQMVSVLLLCWQQHINTPIITENVQDILQSLMEVSQCLPVVQNNIIDPITSILYQQNQTSGILESALELLTLLVQRSGNPLPDFFYSKPLHPLLNLMMNSTDEYVLQNGTSCLKSYVYQKATQLLHWNSPHDHRTGIERVMDVAARLLHPDTPDIAAIHVGHLITQIILQLGSEIPAEIIKNMIVAVTKRLELAKIPELTQALCIVFARLFHSHGSALIDLLYNQSAPNENFSNSLHFVFCIWLQSQPEFYGAYDIKISITALAQILLLQDPRLESFTVVGDKIENDPDTKGRKMRTRSQTKNSPVKFDQVSFSQRVVVLLIRSISQLDENEEEEWESSSDESDIEYTTWNLSDAIETKAFHEISERRPSVHSDDFEEKMDPLYSVDLKVFVKDFISQIPKFADIYSRLAPKDQAILNELSQERK